MVRTVDYESRRRAVLASTINRYIKDAVPVSSQDLANDFALSPATIRNIFAQLEDTGYLMHPYTSAGRIPTNKGYRYYVDFLLSQMGLLQQEKNSIAKGYQGKIERLEDALEKTSEILSSITHYAGIVSVLNSEDKFFYKGISFILEQPEFQDSHRIRFLIKMIEDKHQLLGIINREFRDKFRVYIGEELGCAEIDNCGLVVSNYCIKNKPSGRLAVLGPMRMEYRHIIPTLEYISDVLSDVLQDL